MRCALLGAVRVVLATTLLLATALLLVSCRAPSPARTWLREPSPGAEPARTRLRKPSPPLRGEPSPVAEPARARLREPSPPVREPSPTHPAYAARLVALRTILGRAGIELEIQGATQTIHGAACGAWLACQCELAGESDWRASAALEQLVVAFERYPVRVLEDTRIKRVALCRSIRLANDRFIGGTIDLEERRLYLALEAFFESPLAVQADEEAVHHELFHLFEYERMHERAYDDPEWREANPPGFAYYNRPQNLPPPAGFVTSYSTHHPSEDRASVYHYLMARPEELCAIASDDDIVRTKVRILWARIAAVTDIAYLRKRASCVTWVDDPPPPAPVLWTAKPPGGSWLEAPSR